MQTRIEREIVIAAPLDVVWRAVTEPAQVSRWFADEVDLVAKPGYNGRLTFTEHARKQPVSVHITVQSVEPERSWSYRWMHPEDAEPRDGNSTVVVFTLTPEGDGTRLRVVETGMERMGWSAEEHDSYVDDHTEGWTIHLDRLAEYLGRQPAN
jgi:uncharacterized protein YndB with AHSA1/START domain